ncbi:MAG: transcription termination factor Rho [Chthoniobacteraceae bacterium]
MTADSDSTGVATATAPAPAKAPAELWIDELNALPYSELLRRAEEINLRINPERTRHQIVFDLMRAYASMGTTLFADGVIEFSNQGNGFLRWPRFNFKSLPQDVMLPNQFERAHALRNGNRITARIRPPRDREKFFSVESIIAVEDIPVAEWREHTEFEKLTAMHPQERIVLENMKLASVTARAIDLVAPLGHGQRGLIISPPRVGKTVMLKEIAKAIVANSPETKLILLLIDERPEEVTDFRRSLTNCEIYSSTFDESPLRHTQVAELVSDRAKRQVELGKKVVILLDSITRLSRGYNNMMPGKGRIMSGGVDAKALIKPKKFFSAARNTEEGGSLTVLATCLVETNSKADDLIFEEYKGTGNMEIRLDRSLGDQRIFPAINFPQSATRRDDLLYHPRELEKVNLLRKQLAALPPLEATQVMIHAIQSTHSNAELLLTGLRN